MPDDEFILSDFKKAISKKTSEPVVDLDVRLSSKFDCEIQRMQDIIRVAGSDIPPNRGSHARIYLVTEGSSKIISLRNL